jgi:hypothetical protein
MQKEELKKFENLMKKALDFKINNKQRADSFNKLFDEYIKIDKEGAKWNEFRIKLRKKFVNKLTPNQKKEYALARNQLKKSYFEIQNNIPKSQKSFFPVELFYEISYSIIKKISKKEDKILDIGYGDFPILVNLLNKKGYDAYGIEPFAKNYDKEKTFKCKIKNLPKNLEKLKFKVILANMVYSVNYTSHFSKNFKWELEHRREILKNFFELLDDKGFFILVDDIGTIFSKSDLAKYFQILIFEKDVEVINFDTNKIEDFGKITILRKR